MAMHGHTKIELQDVNTGQKKIVEDDNMVTKALAEMLRPANGWCNLFSIYGFSDLNGGTVNRLSEDIMGGIVCFEKAQEENANNYFRDVTNPIVAKGSNYAYMGADTMQGSYNTEESGMQTDGSYKKVWDFSTNQGNGTIASVSITTSTYGKYGDGCETDEDTTGGIRQAILSTAGLNNSPYYPHKTISINQNTEATFCYADYVKNVIFLIDDINSVSYSSSYGDRHFYNTKKLTLRKVRVAFSKVSLATNPSNMLFEDETIDISIPENLLSRCTLSNAAVSWYYDIGYLYFVFYNSYEKIKSGQSISILKVNMMNFTTETISVVNSSPGYIYFGGGSIISRNGEAGLFGGRLVVTNKYIIFSAVVDSKIKLYRQSLQNNADITEFKYQNGEEFVLPSHGVFNKIGDMLYIEKSNGIYTTIFSFSCNLETGKIKRARNSVARSRHSFVNDRAYSDDFYMFEVMGGKPPVLYSLRSNSSGITLAPFYRADIIFTINNLPTPVVKTASQTMKITYTITEE